MAELQDSDKFLVNRSGKSYQVTKDNLMAQLQDDDLLLVNRSNKSYKITGQEFKDSLSAPPIIQSVTLVQDESTLPAFAAKISSAQAVINTMFTDGLTFDGNIEGDNYATNAFDGNPDTQFSVTGTWAQVEKMGLTGVMQISGKFGGNGSNQQTIRAYNKDGQEVARKDAWTGGQTTIPILVTAPVDVDKIRVERGGGRPGWFTIEINGEALTAADENTELKFAVGEDISDYTVGDKVKEFGNGDDGEGTIKEIDVDNRTIELFELDNNWNAGSYMVPASASGGGGSNRFTNRSYTTTAVMLDNGNPASTKSIRGWVEGKLISSIETDEITAVSPDGKTLTFSSDKDLSKLDVNDDITQSDSETPLVNAPLKKNFDSIGNPAYGNVEIGTLNNGTGPSIVTKDGYECTFFPKPAGTTGRGNGCALYYSDFSSIDWTTEKVVISCSFWVPADPQVTNYMNIIGQDTRGDSNSFRICRLVKNGSNLECGTTGISVPKETWVKFTYIHSPAENKRTFIFNGTESTTGLSGVTLTSHETLDVGLRKRGDDYDGDSTGEFYIRDLRVGKDFAATGTVASVSEATNQLTMSVVYGSWGPPNSGLTAIGASEEIDNAKRYLNLDADLNVIGLNGDDSYTRTPGNSVAPKISFPGTLDNGETPDTALPDGTSIQTEILAENTAGSDEMASNVYTPTPSCVSGPIETDVITAVDVSAAITYSDNVTTSTSFINNRGPELAFDGNDSTSMAVDGAAAGNDAAVITFTPPIPCSTLRMNLAAAGAQSGGDITVNTSSKGAVPGGARAWYNYGTPTGNQLERIVFSNSPNVGIVLAAVEVDGRILENGDTVTTLTFASDKDLTKLQSGDDIHQDNAIEEATLPIAIYTGDLQPMSGRGVEKIFTAPQTPENSWAAKNPGTAAGDYAELKFSPPIPCEKLKIHGGWARISHAYVLINDSFELENTTPDPGTAEITSGITELESIKFIATSNNPTEIGHVSGLEIDNGSGYQFVTEYIAYNPRGTVGAVDTSGNTIVFSTKVGNWGPANSGRYAIGPDYTCPAIVLSAEDPADVATFNNIKDSLDDYAAERAQFRADLRQRLIAAGFSQEEMVQLMVVDDGDVAFSKDGYFPLYLTEEEANRASDNGSSHAHVMDGETYYMPDTGVTLYHGTYGMAPEDAAAGTADISDVADNTDTTGTADISDDDSGDSSY